MFCIVFLLSTLQGYSRKIKINADFSAFFLFFRCVLKHESFEFDKIMDFFIFYLSIIYLKKISILQNLNRNWKEQ